jgi:hypothetical protein
MMPSVSYSLVRAALSPALRLSPTRLRSSYTTDCTRARRMMNISMLRPFMPPTRESQQLCLAWVMSEDEMILSGSLCAAVMLQSRAMRRLLVASPLRERLVSIIGMECLTEALRHEGPAIDPVSDACNEQDLRAMGYAVLYRYLRGESLELSRRLLRRVDKDDPCFRQCIEWVRRLKGHSCEPIGAMVVSRFRDKGRR